MQPNPGIKLAASMRRLLPKVLLEKIFAFVASPQPTILLQDMLSFHCTRDQLHDTYTNIFIPMDFDDPFSLLSYDLEGFMNEDPERIHGFEERINGYEDIFYERWARYPFANSSRASLRAYAESFFTYHVRENLSDEESTRRAKKHINIMLGILTPTERAHLIEI